MHVHPDRTQAVKIKRDLPRLHPTSLTSTCHRPPLRFCSANLMAEGAEASIWVKPGIKSPAGKGKSGDRACPIKSAVGSGHKSDQPRSHVDCMLDLWRASKNLVNPENSRIQKSHLPTTSRIAHHFSVKSPASLTGAS